MELTLVQQELSHLVGVKKAKSLRGMAFSLLSISSTKFLYCKVSATAAMGRYEKGFGVSRKARGVAGLPSGSLSTVLNSKEYSTKTRPR